MVSRSIITKGTGGNGSKAYLCAGCGHFVSSSDRLLNIYGHSRHHFVNPDGIACDFYSFQSSPGTFYHGEATEEYSWFPGYQWRLAFCIHCHQHLGWHYSAVSMLERPNEFWGLLIDYLTHL